MVCIWLSNFSHFIFFVFYLLYIISILHFLFWICIWIVCLLVISMLSFLIQNNCFSNKNVFKLSTLYKVLKLEARGRCFLRFVKKKKKVLWRVFRHFRDMPIILKQDPNSKILSRFEKVDYEFMRWLKMFDFVGRILMV